MQTLNLVARLMGLESIPLQIVISHPKGILEPSIEATTNRVAVPCDRIKGQCSASGCRENFLARDIKKGANQFSSPAKRDKRLHCYEYKAFWSILGKSPWVMERIENWQNWELWLETKFNGAPRSAVTKRNCLLTGLVGWEGKGGVQPAVWRPLGVRREEATR